MTKFIPAEELKKKYSVQGRFYVLNNGKSKTRCRSLLTITETANKNNKKLVVIMLNPGSSRPLDKNHKEEEVATNNMSRLKQIQLVPTKPDTTQYQVMRVMNELNFSSAEILNLFDIREAKSTILFSNIKKGNIDREASIFSDKRKTELQNYFTPDTAVIVAWGNGKSFFDIEKNAIEKISALTDKIFLVRSNDNITICHPSPMIQSFKLRWLDMIIKQLKSSKKQKFDESIH
jgi:hypothetical protein